MPALSDDEKICSRCAETIKKVALIGRYCRHEFDEQIEEGEPSPDEEV